MAFDPAELARLQAKLVALQNLRDSGQSSIQYEGRRISYQSGADLRAAIAALINDINTYTGATALPTRTIRFSQRGNGYGC